MSIFQAAHNSINQKWTYDTHNAGKYKKNKYTPDLEQPAQLDVLLDMPVADKDTQTAHSWNPKDRSRNIVVNDDNPLTFHRLPYNAYSTDCIRGRKGFTQGLHVWQIVWPHQERGTHAVVGVATKDAPLNCRGYRPLVGSNQESWGWDLILHKLYHDEKNYMMNDVTYPSTLARGKTFKVPDSFLVILDMNEGTLSYMIENQVNKQFTILLLNNSLRNIWYFHSLYY